MRLLQVAVLIGVWSCAGDEGPPGQDGMDGMDGQDGMDGAQRIVYRSTFTGLDNADSGKLGFRTLSFDKNDPDTSLRLAYFDSFAAQKQGDSPCACRWTLLINDEECADPGTVAGDVGSIVEQTFVTSTITGYCEGVAAGPISLEVSIGMTPGTSGCDCTTGLFETIGMLEAEELE